jgi:WD40 repeat protein
MRRDKLGPDQCGPDHPYHSGDARRGTMTRAQVPVPGWRSVLVALIVGGAYLAGSPPDRIAGRISLRESADRTRAIAFGSRAELLAATNLNGTIRAWRIDTGSGRATPTGPALPGHAAAFSHDGVTLAVGSDSAVTLGQAATDGKRRTLRTGGGETRALTFSRDGRLLAAMGERGVSLWDTVSGERAASRIELSDASGLALGPDGRSLVTGGFDGWVRFWDLEAGRQRLAVRAHDSFATALALSDDGRTLASASHGDRVARIWDVVTGRRLVELRGHTASVLAVAFAPGGRLVVTGGSDEAVRLWDLPSGRDRARLSCPGIRPVALAFSPDGRALAAGGIEPEVQIWDISDIAGPFSFSGRKKGSGPDPSQISANLLSKTIY